LGEKGPGELQIEDFRLKIPDFTVVNMSVELDFPTRFRGLHNRLELSHAVLDP
jgi:hypothetical protein